MVMGQRTSQTQQGSVAVLVSPAAPVLVSSRLRQDPSLVLISVKILAKVNTMKKGQRNSSILTGTMCQLISCIYFRNSKQILMSMICSKVSWYPADVPIHQQSGANLIQLVSPVAKHRISCLANAGY